MKEIKQLLEITKRLRDNPANRDRKFSLDGKLVGDIGEVLAAEKYGLDLLPENSRVHDAREIKTGRLVQIKATFKGYAYFPYKAIPDYYISLKIDEDGNLEEQFNGPGSFLKAHYIVKRNLKAYNNTFYTLSKGILKKLNEEVPPEDKIKILK